MTHSYFVGYEVVPLREVDDSYAVVADDDTADFWSLYGVLPGGKRVCIGDYSDQHEANSVRDLLTNS
jgi:hypothetical protein